MLPCAAADIDLTGLVANIMHPSLIHEPLRQNQRQFLLKDEVKGNP
jgi:hypothetical protein